VTGAGLDVVVPAGAGDGPLLVQAGSMASAPSEDEITIGVPATELGVAAAPIAKLVANLRSCASLDTRLSARTVYFGGARPATLTVTVKGTAPVALSVALVRVTDGTPTATAPPASARADPATPTRARTSSPPAAPRSSPPATGP
jgi:hypothetical protein